VQNTLRQRVMPKNAKVPSPSSTVDDKSRPVDKFVTRTTTRVLTRGEPVQAHSRDRPRVCSEKFVLDDPLSPR